MCNIAANLFIVELRDSIIRSILRARVSGGMFVVSRQNGQILQKPISAKKVAKLWLLDKNVI